MAEVYANAFIEAAKIAGESPVMDAIAQQIAAAARAASAHDHDYSSSIEVRTGRGRRGVRDRIISVADPLGVPKEFGHVIRNQPDGPELGYVPGQHYMQKALQQIPGTNGD